MPFQFSDSMDDELLFERCESFGGGMDAFNRATLLGPDQWQYAENIVVPDNLRARTRAGADSLGGATPEDAAAATSATVFASQFNPVFNTETFTLTATVTSPDGTPTGTVQFFDGSTLLGTAALANGVATLSTSFATGGVKAVQALYSGAAPTFAPSTSAILTLNVYTITFTASGPVLADGNAASTVVFNLKDQNLVPLAGVPASFLISGSDNISSTPPPATDASGNISWTLKSHVAEVKSFSAIVYGRQAPQHPTATFTAQDPDRLKSIAFCPPGNVPADNATTKNINIVVRDPNFNVCPGVQVTITATGAGNTITVPAVTDVNGITTATIRSSVAGTKTISVVVPGTAVPGVIEPQPTVTFV